MKSKNSVICSDGKHNWHTMLILDAVFRNIQMEYVPYVIYLIIHIRRNYTQLYVLLLYSANNKVNIIHWYTKLHVLLLYSANNKVNIIHWYTKLHILLLYSANNKVNIIHWYTITSIQLTYLYATTCDR